MKDEFVARVGIWGQRRYNYLKKNSPAVINVMRLKGALEQYLIDIDRDAQEMYDKLIRQYAENEGVTEELKRQDQMAWVGAMNNIRARVNEQICNDIIYV